MVYFFSLLSSGLMIGIIYSLMAMGLTLIYSILGIINFAHGEFYMLGGYASYYLLAYIAGLPPLAAVPLAGLIVTLLGLLLERWLLRPMHQGKIERPGEYAILITLGLAFILQNLALAVFGPYPMRPPSFVKGSLDLGILKIGADRAVAAGFALLLLLLLYLIINYTWLGKALRAVSQDKEAAAVIGINPLTMNTIAFGVGAGLAAISGALLAPIFMVTPTVGAMPGIRSYVIVVLGGLGSIPGSILGGLIIGLVESLGTGYFPDINRAVTYKNVYGLLIFAFILLLRPRGLFGREE